MALLKSIQSAPENSATHSVAAPIKARLSISLRSDAPRLDGRGYERGVFGRHCVAWWLALVFCGGLTPAQAATPTPSKEDQIKAAFLFNFTKFVEWPAERFPEPANPIVIGVAGPSPIGEALTEIVRGRQTNGRTIVVKRVEAPEDLSSVHVLFVPDGEERRLDRAAPALRTLAVLVVTDSNRAVNFAHMIHFVREADKLRFDIDLAAAEQARLKISAQLLKLAVTVRRKS